MKKPKLQQIKENPQQKLNNPSPFIEIKKNLIYNRKAYKKEKTLPTKANTTMTESSKEDKKEKKETIIKKKYSKESSKLNKSNLSLTFPDKKLNKTMDADHMPIKKKKIKKHRNSTKVKCSLSQKHFCKLKNSTSTKMNLIKNKTPANSYLLSANNNESSNNIMLGSEDNFIKTLLNKYMDGTDNIINEDSEAFININNNGDFENISLFGEENENTETNTIIETLDLKKDKEKENYENHSNKNLTKVNLSKSLNFNLNSTKNKKKESNLMLKINNSESNKIKSNLCDSPTKGERLSIDSSNKQNKDKKNLSKKTNSTIPCKTKSFSQYKKSDDLSKIRSNSSKKDKEKLKRKILYAAKLMKGINKLKQKNKIKTEIDYSNKQDIIPTIATNTKLDVIFENKNLKPNILHHYLENTVSAKNKMVQKKQGNITDQKHLIKSFQKPEINTNNTNNHETNISSPYIGDKNLLMIKTPKINKQMRERFSLNFSSKNNLNNNQNKNNNGRKLSHHVKCECNLDNSISSKSLINSKIFQKKIDDYLITRELGKGSYAVVKLAMDKKTKNKYAIKIYSKTCLIDPQLRNTVKNEINILKQIDNENVMKLYEVIDTQSNLYLVLEYINGINLLEIIKNEKNHFIKEFRAKKIFSKIVQGINYCHQINIFHRDIKLENILVLKDDSVKIIDFGFGIICKSDTYQKLFCGTKSYMPPEIVKKEKYIASYSDIWSLGVLFYAMLFGVFPFKGKDDDDLFDKIIEAKLNFPEYNPISDKTKELFGKIFVINPSERIKLDEMINYLKEEE